MPHLIKMSFFTEMVLVLTQEQNCKPNKPAHVYTDLRSMGLTVSKM